MATSQDIRAALGDELNLLPAPAPTTIARNDLTGRRSVQHIRNSQPRRFKKSSLRSRGRSARWMSHASTMPTRTDTLHLRRWQRVPLGTTEEPVIVDRYSKYNILPEVPTYDDDIYDKHLTSGEWSREDTDQLITLYQECNGKWPVIFDHYEASTSRSMEDLKARFYSVSAIILAINTPITSMTAPEYTLYETLTNFNPRQETSRKLLAEGHFYRRQNEVDEETVLLGELQRIMLNQATLDGEREELRRRLDHPIPSTNGYQYSTSQALTTLWQQLLAQDRLKKTTQRLRPTGNPSFDGTSGTTPTSARPRESNAGLPDISANQRRGARDSLASTTATPQAATTPSELSKADMLRFGVIQPVDKLPSGVTFASDRLSKPRVAKSALQTEKIAAILTHIGVPDLIPLPTVAVIEQFDVIMNKVHALLDLRKLAEKEEQELRIRSAEKTYKTDQGRERKKGKSEDDVKDLEDTEMEGDDP